MASIFPKEDARQALRIRRALIAAGGYLVIGAVAYLGFYFGYARELGVGDILMITAVMLALNITILALMYSGINERFRDPSLTFLQILCGILFTTFVAYHMVDRIRGAATVIYIMVFVFGTFRLRLLDFLILTGLTGALYGGAMGLLYVSAPTAVDPELEVMRWVILMMALVWISYMANYIANLRRRIKRLASHDSLTGVLNRREIFEVLNREKAFADRSGVPFSLCILDLDDFKKINDVYGHQAGDAVLRAFSRVLKISTRAEDYVGRYGGEEFLVLFSNFQCVDSKAGCAQRLLHATENMALPDISPDLKVTTSIGIASYQPAEPVDILLARADEALYEAKKNGKNQAVFKGADVD